MCPVEQFQLPPEFPKLEVDSSSGPRVDQTLDALVGAWLGVIFAGGLLPALWGCVGFSVGIIYGGLSIEQLAVGIMFFSVICFLGMIVAGFGYMVAFMLLGGLHWSSGNSLSPRFAVSLAGGFSGFIGLSPMILPALFYGGNFSEICSGYFIVVFPAMVVGHWGGVISATWKDTRALVSQKVKQKQSHQFQIRHLMILTAWVAVIVGVDQLTVNFLILKALGFWMFGQILILLMDRIWLVVWNNFHEASLRKGGWDRATRCPQLRADEA